MSHSYYYSEGLNQQVLELSDRHVWWDITTYNVHDNDITESFLEWICNKFAAIFKEHYHTEVYFCGRSGRHVCVEDTAVNRRNYPYMCKAVEIMQRLIIFNTTRNEDYFKQNINGKVPKWMKFACKREFKYLGKWLTYKERV